MHIVIPVSHHDIHLFPKFLSLLERFKGLDSHRITLSVTRGQQQAVEPYLDRLKALCPTVAVLPVPDFRHGWFTGSNMHFHATVMGIAMAGNNEPWFWMELDCLPVRENWIGILQSEYYRDGRRFMGMISTVSQNTNGELVEKAGDYYLQGCAIYPPHIQQDPAIYPVLSDLAKPPPSCPQQPFDLHLRYAIRKHAANTALIHDAWQTCNYRYEGSDLVCDNTDKSLLARRRGGVIEGNPVLIHGCKDSSLADLILSGARRGSLPASGKESKPVKADEDQEEVDIFDQRLPWEQIKEIILSEFPLEEMTPRQRQYIERIDKKRAYDAARPDKMRLGRKRLIHEHERAKREKVILPESSLANLKKSGKGQAKPKDYIEQLHILGAQDAKLSPAQKYGIWPTSKQEIEDAQEKNKHTMRLSEIMAFFGIPQIQENRSRMEELLVGWGYTIAPRSRHVRRVEA